MWSLKRFFAQRCWYMVNLLYVADPLLDLTVIAKGPGVTSPGDWRDGVQQVPLLTQGPQDRPLWWAESLCWSQRGAGVEVWRAEHKSLGDWKASQTSLYGTWSADFLVNASWTEAPKMAQVAKHGQLSSSPHRQWCQQVAQPTSC